MRQLTILSGAGINMGIAGVVPQAYDLPRLTYREVSHAVYNLLAPQVRAMFQPESFDHILGGLMTVNLAIEMAKQDMRRFNVNEQAFAELFMQTQLQHSVGNALTQIEHQLRISWEQMMDAIDAFDPAIEALMAKYDSINYVTLNLDAIFDHILLGRNYKRGAHVTDFWARNGGLNRVVNRKIKIFHLHGDLRCKPTKKTDMHNPPYAWPVLVVGDQRAKASMIGASEYLQFFNGSFEYLVGNRDPYLQNDLAVIGFGFREEDVHVVNPLVRGIHSGVFNSISNYDVENHLTPRCAVQHSFSDARQFSLIDYLQFLAVK